MQQTRAALDAKGKTGRLSLAKTLALESAAPADLLRLMGLCHAFLLKPGKYQEVA